MRPRGRRTAAAFLLVACVAAGVAWFAGEGGGTSPGDELTVGDRLADATPTTDAPAPGRRAGDATGDVSSAGGIWLAREEAPIEAPAAHRAVWTGDALVAWGGDGESAAYDLRQRRWRALPPAPTGALLGPLLVWTGSETLVWGGQLAEGGWSAGGAALDHHAASWQALPEAPAALRAPVGAWTGRELLVWGAGEHAVDGRAAGLAFDPRRGRWRHLPRAPVASVRRAAAAWTGRELLVWGHEDGGEPFLIAYAPSRGAWRRLAAPPLSNPARAAAAWTGEEGRGELVLWGRPLAGQRSSAPPAGAAFDPGTGSWRLLPPAPGYDWTGSGWGAHGLRATWTGERVLVVGGYPDSVTLAYEPASDEWLTMPDLPGVIDPVLEWTGEFVSSTGVQRHGELLLWGGYGPFGPTATLHTWRTVGLGPTSDARLNTGS